MPRYKLTLAYDGTDFCGWQKQEPPDPADPAKRTTLRTVQGVLEQTVRDTLREPVVLMGASRTDSGVHALGQVAAFTSNPIEDKGIGWPESRGTETLLKALNSKLPHDILITSAEVVPHDFNPIGGALEKEYTYTILSSSTRPLWDRRYVYHTWYPLDLSRMQKAATALVGEHDFAAFAQIDHGRTTTVRTIFRCEVESLFAVGAASRRPSEVSSSHPGRRRDAAPTESTPIPQSRLLLRLSGNGFLYNMVRIIAGTLLEVGRGKLDPKDIPAILASTDRKQAGPTLPPQGLRLEWVRYE